MLCREFAKDLIGHAYGSLIGSFVVRTDWEEFCAESRVVADNRCRRMEASCAAPAPCRLGRWNCAFQAGGIEAILPKRRSDFRRGRALTDIQRQLMPSSDLFDV
jgi:hypothetical protein